MSDKPFIHSRPLAFTSGDNIVDRALLKLLEVAREFQQAKEQWLSQLSGPTRLKQDLFENFKQVQAAVATAAADLVVAERVYHKVNLEMRLEHYWHLLRIRRRDRLKREQG